MLQFGILTPEQYSRATRKRRTSGSGVAFTLLQTSDPATQEDIQRFEEISYRLRTSNGTTRMTFRNRMHDVNEVALNLLRASYGSHSEILVQDRAASTCLTSMEWAQQLLGPFPKLRFEASDALLHLFRVTLKSGQVYIVEPSGRPLQFIEPPFAVCLCPREPLRYPLNHLIVVRGRSKYRKLSLSREPLETIEGHEYRIDKISCVHPEVLSFARTFPNFAICPRSIFDRAPIVDVLRTMNILNLSYFTTSQLREGIEAAFHSVKLGGLWILGRTLEENSQNLVTFFRRTSKGWEVVDRIRQGSEIERLVLDFAGDDFPNGKR
jgi:hypothetical protein